jgi:hypothetical protein
MFSRFPPVLHPHRICRRPAVHRLPRILVEIAHDHPPRRLRTLRLQEAAAAHLSRVLFLVLGMGSLVQAQRGGGRTAPAVAFRFVAEPVTAEVLGPVRIDGLGGSGDAILLAERSLLAVRIDS